MKKVYFKKSLSLFMAVMMLLSCWVFVAPTEAEAAVDVSYQITSVWIRSSLQREKWEGAR